MPRRPHRLTKRQRRFLEARYIIFREPADNWLRGRRLGWIAITQNGPHHRYWRMFRYELERDLLRRHDRELPNRRDTRI